MANISMHTLIYIYVKKGKDAERNSVVRIISRLETEKGQSFAHYERIRVSNLTAAKNRDPFGDGPSTFFLLDHLFFV